MMLHLDARKRSISDRDRNARGATREIDGAQKRRERLLERAFVEHPLALGRQRIPVDHEANPEDRAGGVVELADVDEILRPQRRALHEAGLHLTAANPLAVLQREPARGVARSTSSALYAVHSPSSWWYWS